MKQKEKSTWGWIDLLLILIALVPITASLLVYSKLPDNMAMHFGFDQADGFQSKPFAIILLSLLVIGFPILLKFSRNIDPKRDNYWKFERSFEAIRVAVTILLNCAFGFILLINLGYPVSIQFFTMIMTGLLFMVLGNYLMQIRFNYLIGIRTPWTLASEEVWRRTHRMAGPLFMAVGALLIIGNFLPGAWAHDVLIGGIVVVIVIPVGYSYIVYKKISG